MANDWSKVTYIALALMLFSRFSELVPVLLLNWYSTLEFVLVERNSQSCLFQTSAEYKIGKLKLLQKRLQNICPGSNFLFGLKIFKLVLFLFSFVPVYGNESKTKENKN